MNDSQQDVRAEWTVSTIGRELHLVNGFGFKPEQWQESGTPIIRIQNLNDRSSPFNYVQHRVDERFFVESGDLLFSWSGSRGTSFGPFIWDRGHAVLNQHIFNVRIANDSIGKQFCYYWLKFLVTEIEHQAHGSAGLVHITRKQLVKFRFPLPPVPQQRKIAKILTTVDNLIETTEALIAKYQAVKQGMMHDLFTRGVDEHGHLRTPYDEAPELYKKSELGWIPKEWEVQKVGDFVTDWAVGPRFSGELYADAGNVATLRTTDMDDEGNLNLLTMPLAKLSLPAFRPHLLQPGDLVISRSGTCGVTAIFPGYDVPVLPGAFLIRFRFRSEMEPKFLKRFFNSPRGRARVMLQAEGGVQKNIRGTSILRIKLAVPPADEQRCVNRRLASVDSLVQQEVRYACLLQVKKTGLMQDLLTGTVRVNMGESEETTE